ncbi:hypothetical protein BH23ACT2_BH23ACT2_30990 [soil metagenome]
MSKSNAARLDAIVAVFKDGNPAASAGRATCEEKIAVKDRHLPEFVVERSLRHRSTQTRDPLLTYSSDDPPTWPQLFDDLSPEPLEGVVGPYDAPSAGAPPAQHAHRYGTPSAV